jgi:transcriptional regulator with XRE-family HTH domain
MPERMTFAEAIRRVRTARRLTQADLAARAGITRTTLTRLEGGLKPGPLARQHLLGALRFANLNELYAAAGEHPESAEVSTVSSAADAGSDRRQANLVPPRPGRMRWGAW